MYKIGYNEENKIYQYSTTVRVGDLNYGNHLAHDKLVTIVHDARVSFLTSVGLSEYNVGDNTALLLKLLHADYTKQSYLGERLEISIYSGEVKKTSFELIYVVNNQSGRIALFLTLMVCFDLTTQKIKPIPLQLLPCLKEAK